MRNTIIRNAKEFSGNGPVWIYGSGERGAELLDQFRRFRPDAAVAGFLDSFNNGTAHGLPVVRIQDYTPAPQDTIIIASTFDLDIIKLLHRRDMRTYLVYGEISGEAQNSYESVISGTHTFWNGEEPRTKAGSCANLASGLVLTRHGLSACCDLPTLSPYLDDFKATMDALLSRKRDVVQDIACGRNRFCATCPGLTRQAPDVEQTVTSIMLGYGTTCNLTCSYCTYHHPLNPRHTFDMAGFLGHVLEHHINPDAFNFIWGGCGEPLLESGFKRTVSLFLEHGLKGTIATNCTLYAKDISQGLRQGLFTICCSLDSGTPQTYHKVKGEPLLDRCVANLRRYAQDAADSIVLKYILVEDNASRAEIDAFQKLCQDIGVRRVQLAYNVWALDQHGKYTEAHQYFRRMAIERGLDCVAWEMGV